MDMYYLIIQNIISNKYSKIEIQTIKPNLPRAAFAVIPLAFII